MSLPFAKIAYLCFFLWFCVTGPLRPLANYDMFPYVGVVLSYSDKEESLREKSLQDVKKYVSDVQYKNFVNGNTYIETVAHDDKAFLEQLPGYRVKPLYVLMVRFFSIATDSISFASVIVSAFGFFLMATALYLLRPKGFWEPFYLIAVIALSYFGVPSFTVFPSVASPDSLAIGITLLGFWALLRNPSSLQPPILFSLAVLARPDVIVTLVCLVPFMIKVLFNEKNSNRCIRSFGLTIAVPFAVYLCSTVLFPSFSLKQLMVFAFEGPFPYISDIDTSNFWKIYKTTLLRDVFLLSLLPRFAIFVILNVALLIYSFGLNGGVKYILLAAVGNIFFKIILFPNFDGGFGERFFCVSYFLVIYALFKIINDQVTLSRRCNTV